jgi:hypothetical protein
MSIGLVQAVFNTAGFVLARLLHRKSAPRHLIGLHGGLGKVFWKLPTRTALYAESEDLID